MSFVISNLTNVPIDKKLLQKLGQKIWQALRLPKDIKISLVFIEKKKIKELNQKWRARNQVTDILSFNYQTNQNQFILPLPRENLLGELFICLSQIKKQAKEHSISWQTELTEILIHGILHLLGYDHQIGYDHQTKAGRQKMEMKIEEILTKLEVKSQNQKIKR